jgi:hypothetical protein
MHDFLPRLLGQSQLTPALMLAGLGVAFLLGSLFIVTILYTFQNLSGLTIELVVAARDETPRGKTPKKTSNVGFAERYAL